MRSLIRPLFIQLLVGALAARAEDYPSTVRLDIWIPIDTDAISMNAAEWDGRWVIREQWEEYSRYWCPRKGFRKIGDIRMDTDSVEDLSIYFDPFSERYIRVKCQATRKGETTFRGVYPVYVNKTTTEAVFNLDSQATIELYCEYFHDLTNDEQTVQWGKDYYAPLTGPFDETE